MLENWKTMEHKSDRDTKCNWNIERLSTNTVVKKLPSSKIIIIIIIIIIIMIIIIIIIIVIIKQD